MTSPYPFTFVEKWIWNFYSFCKFISSFDEYVLRFQALEEKVQKAEERLSDQLGCFQQLETKVTDSRIEVDQMQSTKYASQRDLQYSTEVVQQKIDDLFASVVGQSKEIRRLEATKKDKTHRTFVW